MSHSVTSTVTHLYLKIHCSQVKFLLIEKKTMLHAFLKKVGRTNQGTSILLALLARGYYETDPPGC